MLVLIWFSVYLNQIRKEGDQIIMVHVSEYTSLVQARKYKHFLFKSFLHKGDVYFRSVEIM